MGKLMSGQGCTIGFNIQKKIRIETGSLQKTKYRGGIVVVLMGSRLHRFGFDEEISLKALFPSIVTGQPEKGGQVFFFALHVGVYQAHIAFTPAPKDVVLTIE